MQPPLNRQSLPESVQNVIAKGRSQLSPCEILLFGSRARETASPVSDFDFAFKGVQDEAKWIGFSNYVQHDAPTLYRIDLVRFETATEDLKHVIETEGRLVVG